MPLYICNMARDTLDASAKQAIAQSITDIHCDVTGAPPMFVHVAFFDEAPMFPLDDNRLFVRGTIRKGRSDDQKHAIADRIRKALATHSGVAADLVDAQITWIPVAPGNGFTEGRPSTSSVVSFTANEALSPERRETLLRDLVGRWTQQTGSSIDEIVAVIADPA